MYKRQFPDWSVRRAFTSQIIIDRVKERDGVEIDNVKAALDRAVENGVKTLVVQPTHLMDGLESVSYTHLDVYKRQGLGLAGGRGDTPSQPAWKNRHIHGLTSRTWLPAAPAAGPG